MTHLHSLLVMTTVHSYCKYYEFMSYSVIAHLYSDLVTDFKQGVEVIPTHSKKNT